MMATFHGLGPFFLFFQSHQSPRLPDLGTNEVVVYSYLDVAVQLQWLRHFFEEEWWYG